MRFISGFYLATVVFLIAACAGPVKPAPTAAVVPSAASPALVIPSAATLPTPSIDPLTTMQLQEKQAAFVAQTAQATAIAPSEIAAWLAQARYQQSIINAITRPAEAKPWKDYRPIFLTDARIKQGRAFLAEHRDQLNSVSAQTGVPTELIVAIIGVETSYGANTGSYRVLDALYTLGFFYPKRESFFRSELAQLFALAKDERLDPTILKGSYAGAMGWGQFMPSSYRNYGKDGDGDGRRDLFNSPRDVFASIANYFVGYGWRRGEPIFIPATASANAAPFVPENFQAIYSLADLAARGYRPVNAGAVELPMTLVTLDGSNGPEYWLGYNNFYVLTRYNRSPLYAMAVYQLAVAIGSDANATVIPAP